MSSNVQTKQESAILTEKLSKLPDTKTSGANKFEPKTLGEIRSFIGNNVKIKKIVFPLSDKSTIELTDFPLPDTDKHFSIHVRLFDVMVMAKLNITFKVSDLWKTKNAKYLERYPDIKLIVNSDKNVKYLDYARLYAKFSKFQSADGKFFSLEFGTHYAVKFHKAENVLFLSKKFLNESDSNSLIPEFKRIL